MKFDYVRFLLKDQNSDCQIRKLRSLGIEDRYIFIYKKSGKDFDRPQYQSMLLILRKGDLLYLDALDRSGTDYEGIIRE
ncbi:recombinase family protein [Carnobacterium maltaromaticum]|uniref:recombinase family protein n=1 Tax=Carnobacterium maltaromaticum TaxID=2751 RepID=UPI00295F53CF|nr:recombinase family protein [Carnobacterium maltaromaticum]